MKYLAHCTILLDFNKVQPVNDNALMLSGK